jgi:hypothetical protein
MYASAGNGDAARCTFTPSWVAGHPPALLGARRLLGDPGVQAALSAAKCPPRRRPTHARVPLEPRLLRKRRTLLFPLPGSLLLPGGAPLALALRPRRLPLPLLRLAVSVLAVDHGAAAHVPVVTAQEERVGAAAGEEAQPGPGRLIVPARRAPRMLPGRLPLWLAGAGGGGAGGYAGGHGGESAAEARF